MRSERHGSSRTKFVRSPFFQARGVSSWALVATVLLGAMVVLIAQGFALPAGLVEFLRNLPFRNPWFIGISAYAGLMLFLGCCLSVIPREDDGVEA